MEPPPVIAKPRAKKRNKILAVAVIAAVLAALALGLYLKRQTPPITVQTTKVSRHSLTNLVVANGQIQPVVQVTISPEVSGEIIDLPVKEGQLVNKGDLLVKIKPDVYVAAVNQAKASYASSVAGLAQSAANVEKAEADYERNLELFNRKLLSESDFVGFKAARDVARAQLESATNQVNMAKAGVDSAEEQLAKTTIFSPVTGTITRLNSAARRTRPGHGPECRNRNHDHLGFEPDRGAGERGRNGRGRHRARPASAAGGGRLQGPQIHRRGDECRQFRRRFRQQTASTQQQQPSQQATQFEVRIRVNEKEPAFRPGMSVTAEIETEYRTNALTVPLASVTTRPMKPVKTDPPKNGGTNATASAASGTNAVAGTNNVAGTNTGKAAGKLRQPPKRMKPPNRPTWSSWWKATT